MVGAHASTLGARTEAAPCTAAAGARRGSSAWTGLKLAGTFAVVYRDRRVKPIGGSRLTIASVHTDKPLYYSDGDRTFKPRPRG